MSGVWIAGFGLLLWLLDFVVWISSGKNKRQNPVLIIVGIVLVVLGSMFLQ